MTYEIRYGHTENSVKHTVHSYEEAIDYAESIKNNSLVCKNSSVTFPMGTIRITCKETGNTMTWHSKEFMEYGGVL